MYITNIITLWKGESWLVELPRLQGVWAFYRLLMLIEHGAEQGTARHARRAVWEEGTHECFVGEGWDQGHHKYGRVCMEYGCTGMDIFKAEDECWVI